MKIYSACTELKTICLNINIEQQPLIANSGHLIANSGQVQHHTTSDIEYFI